MIDCMAHCGDADFLVVGERDGHVHFVDPNVDKPVFSKVDCTWFAQIQPWPVWKISASCIIAVHVSISNVICLLQEIDVDKPVFTKDGKIAWFASSKQTLAVLKISAYSLAQPDLYQSNVFFLHLEIDCWRNLIRHSNIFTHGCRAWRRRCGAYLGNTLCETENVNLMSGTKFDKTISFIAGLLLLGSCEVLVLMSSGRVAYFTNLQLLSLRKGEAFEATEVSLSVLIKAITPMKKSLSTLVFLVVCWLESMYFAKKK